MSPLACKKIGTLADVPDDMIIHFNTSQNILDIVEYGEKTLTAKELKEKVLSSYVVMEEKQDRHKKKKNVDRIWCFSPRNPFV